MKKNDYLFPKKTKKEILEILKTHPLEDLEAIKTIENFLKKKRGYIFKMPKPGEPVVLLLSGGLDSIVIWNILMSKFKLKVYPFCSTTKKGLFRWLSPQFRAVKFFEKYYKKKHPKLYRKPYYFSVNSPQILKHISKNIHKNPEFVLDNILLSSGQVVLQANGLMSSLAFQALDYIELIKLKTKIKITTIFCAVMGSDGTVVCSQTLTSLRTIMLNMTLTSHKSIQFSSLPAEKEMGFFIEKYELLKAKNINLLPLHRTWSCNGGGKIFHCGDCMSCQGRRYSMQKNNIKDQTIYLSDFSLKKQFILIKKIIKKILGKNTINNLKKCMNNYM